MDKLRTCLRFVGYSSGVYKNIALHAAVIAIFPVREKATDAVVMSLLPSKIKTLLQIFDIREEYRRRNAFQVCV